MTYDLVIIGGGAAGFFGAINTAICNPKFKIIILEKSSKLLQKVKVSGGGRCNVTNQISNPLELIKNYPRGENELEIPFQRFGTQDTAKWFSAHGVELKTEKDGRIFPFSNDSQTIIDCFLELCKKYNINILTSVDVVGFIKQENNLFKIETKNEQTLNCRNCLIATGSSPGFISKIEKKGFKIITQTPSLFTFSEATKQLIPFSGNSFQHTKVKIKNTSFSHQGPLLITHWGFSGPAILKLSSSAAFYLKEKNYEFDISINWLGVDLEFVISKLKKEQETSPKKRVFGNNPFEIPNKFWDYICKEAGISAYQNWAETGKKHFKELSNKLLDSTFSIVGKSTFKEEFVTAGGIDLEEINIDTFEHKYIENLYFAGEVLNIDAFTGGFNFQSAWTTSWIVANSIK